ncbi:hypothetical protein [Fervidobacterium sp.]
MRRTGLVVFLAVVAMLLLLAACVPNPFENPPAQQAGELQHVPDTQTATQVTLRQWMYYNATWDGNDYFVGTPTINTEGVVNAKRSDVTSEEKWKAQLIRFYPKNYQKYSIKLWIKANKSATIKAYLGADPYIEELAESKDLEVSTTGREVTLEFGPKNYTGAKFLKFSLEFADVSGLELQVKVLGESFK